MKQRRNSMSTNKELEHGLINMLLGINISNWDT